MVKSAGYAIRAVKLSLVIAVSFGAASAVTPKFEIVRAYVVGPVIEAAYLDATTK